MNFLESRLYNGKYIFQGWRQLLTIKLAHRCLLTWRQQNYGRRHLHDDFDAYSNAPYESAVQSEDAHEYVSTVLGSRALNRPSDLGKCGGVKARYPSYQLFRRGVAFRHLSPRSSISEFSWIWEILPSISSTRWLFFNVVLTLQRAT